MIRSQEFDDVYFSAEDGLAETRHVFLDGNGLPKAWERRDHFVIGETGFGTGLNFLAVWELFEETAEEGQSLHFISVEKFPLSADEISEVLSQWDHILSHYRFSLCKIYKTIQGDQSGIPTGRYVLRMNDRVVLELHIGDANAVMTGIETPVDVWFLDGFRPSSNPEMWTDTVFEQVAGLSKEGTTFATFTSAGFVRRGLEAVGFEVSKVPGFGRKREMSVGVFNHREHRE